MTSDEANEVRAPAMPRENQPNQQNPSIARSMSRYRRNRPATSGNTSVPAIPRHATAPPAALLPNHTKQQMTENVQARDQHRQNAMEQLTGGSKPDRSISLPPKELGREQARMMDQGFKEPARAQGYETAHFEKHHQADSTRVEVPRKSFLQKVKLAKTKEPAEEDERTPRYIGVGGGGIVPGTDAPMSAVNAGERHVRVRYNDTTMDLAITPATQVHDLLLEASQYLSRDIDHEKFIVLESFRQVGLERPLRRYEHVRDVMNSWAHDAASYLIIIPPSSAEALAQLDVHQVPSERPPETTVQLYYSQRPRKWEKRFVTLRSNGQVAVSKKENGKDVTNICHLSDFDIYSPSLRALNKDIKPPKRICLAIKSQEKSSMFLSTENFVHFFATNDRSIADKWHRAVQEWRSWYMVNKLGAGQPRESEAVFPTRSSTQKKVSRSRKPSYGESAMEESTMEYEPSLMQHAFEQSRPSSSKDLFSRKRAMREHAPPPTSSYKALTIDTGVDMPIAENGPLLAGMSAQEMESATFAPTGLLGRTYTQRRHAMREREEREKRAKQEPFSAQGLLNGNQLYAAALQHQQGSFNTMGNGADTASLMSRAQSISQKNKPLVDLTPVFHEPPQHTRKGRGVTVEAGLPLIEGATGPELASGLVAIPPATAWRRPSVEPSQTRSRANTMRSVRHVTQPVHSPGSNSTGASPIASSIPFNPNSLLASSARMPCGQGQAFTGHGVATGDRTATRPMLDMSPENPFAEGSLLRKL